jgi:predicted DNA-binding transcriptional regulator AlpA
VIDEQLAPIRVYRSPDVVEALGIKKTWLKRWVTDRRVPHQRSGALRGVWFTWSDILAIGAMLPELMTTRQSNSLAAAGTPSDEQLDRWAHLGF